MVQLKQRERQLIKLTLALTFAFLAYTRLIEPSISRGIRLATQIAQTEKELSAMQSLIGRRSQIEANSSLLQKQIAIQDSEDQEVKKLLVEIEKLVSESELKTISLRPQKIKDFGHYQLMSTELVIEGNQHALMRFLYRIKESVLLLRVDRLQISALRTASQIRVQCYVVRFFNRRKEP